MPNQQGPGGAGNRKPRNQGKKDPGGKPNEGVLGDPINGVGGEQVSPFKTWWQENQKAILDSYGKKVDKDRARKFARAAWHLRSLLPAVGAEEVPEELLDEDLLGVIPVQAPPTTTGIGGFDVEDLNTFAMGDVVSQMLQARQNKMAAEGDYFGLDELVGGEE